MWWGTSAERFGSALTPGPSPTSGRGVWVSSNAVRLAVAGSAGILAGPISAHGRPPWSRRAWAGKDAGAPSGRKTRLPAQSERYEVRGNENQRRPAARFPRHLL